MTSFIGRERELSEITQLLATTRLITLTGSGGTGKTRLALQMAENLWPSFTDGVWLAELAPLTDASSIPQTIAAIFGLRELPNMPLIDIIINYLHAKQLLLILDNCEHLTEACADLSDHVLRSCPQINMIITSREVLGIAGESAYRVPPLSLPSQAHITREKALEYESVQLFVDRASAINPKFHLTSENAPDIVQICCRLDGIPLALELAAARIRVFSTAEIAVRLEDRYSLLTGGSRTALERHQTLRALIDWSYDLLSDHEQRLFRHLSVFSGGCIFQAAEAVYPDLEILNLLERLVEKSLVMVDEQESSTRYHLLDTIRQYAGEKLLELGESHQAYLRHMDYFLQLAETAESHLHGPEAREWLSRLDKDYDNLRAALEWAMQNDIIIAIRLSTALHWFWNRHGYHVEGRRFLREALDCLQKLPQIEGEATHQSIAFQAKALNAFGRLGFGVGDFAGSLKVFEESISLSRRIGDKYTLAQALSMLAYTKAFLGDPEGSYRAAEEGLSLARGVGDKILLGMSLINRAIVAIMVQDDFVAMRAYAAEGLHLYRESGAQWDFAMALLLLGISATSRGNDTEARLRFEACLPLLNDLGDKNHVNGVRSELAHLERRQGHFTQAQSLYRETLLEWQRLGHRAAIAHELECLAMIAKIQEEDQHAALLFGAAEILREKIAIPMTSVERFEYDREVSELRQDMDEFALARTWSKGRTMSMEQAITLATSDDPS